MNKIAKFSKVSYEQFAKDWKNVFPLYSDEEIEATYDSIMLPRRSTVGSAGYDFYLPDDVDVSDGSATLIPTGIRCEIEDGWMLSLFPRSGHGFKYGIHLANTVGIVDADYAFADNEGHIMVKLVNDSILKKNVHFCKHTAFCQGIFMPFGIAVDDDADGVRRGGFGSTDK
jgi:dUTP pyrophosphatase